MSHADLRVAVRVILVEELCFRPVRGHLQERLDRLEERLFELLANRAAGRESEHHNKEETEICA
jgi:hypothetical protein